MIKKNIWIVPMWVACALMIVLNVGMWATLHTPAWAPITALWVVSFVSWCFFAFKGHRHQY